VAKFYDAIVVVGSDGRYAANLDPEWTVSGNPHGGYLLAVLANAAIAADDAGAHPHPLSASALYVTPPVVGPATVEVEHLRRGRTASQLRARLVQDGQTRVESLFTLGLLDEHGSETWVDAPPPAVAPLTECPRSPVAPPGAGVRVEMLDLVEQRLDPASFAHPGRPAGSFAGMAGGSGELRGWLRFADGEPFDPLSLLYVADSFPPATFTLGSVGWVPTLELTVYLRAVPAPGPLRVRQRVRALAAPVVDQVCEVWDSRGRVVVQATQLALVRMNST
jgi:hypothetical protein